MKTQIQPPEPLLLLLPQKRRWWHKLMRMPTPFRVIDLVGDLQSATDEGWVVTIMADGTLLLDRADEDEDEDDVIAG